MISATPRGTERTRTAESVPKGGPVFVTRERLPQTERPPDALSSERRIRLRYPGE